MKVLFDYQMFSIQKYGGISRYFANLYDKSKANTDIEVKLGLLTTRNYYLENADLSFNNSLTKWLLRKDKRANKWNKKYSKHLIKKGDFDIFHPTYYNPYFIGYITKPFIVTVHDMIYELFPEFFPGNDMYIEGKRRLVEKASHIIAISESTKKDLIQIFNVDKKKITVIPHGFTENNFQVKSDFIPPVKNYILFVGDRATYKNFNRFIKAVKPILEKNSQLSIVCTGGGPFTSPENELFIRHNVKDRVLQISATDYQMKVLYQNAKVFVFPSLYEGFGFPLLEAFVNNCPVASSNTSSFKEVGGNAIAYFDPYNISEITTSIASVLEDNELRNNLIIKGRARLPLFTLDECCNKTFELYKKVLAESMVENHHSK